MFDPINLPYAYDALEPHISVDTMHVHYDKHYMGYTKKLNAAVEGTEYAAKDIRDLLANLEELPEDIYTAVKNNGGGYYNHTLFWQVLSPQGGTEPEGELAEAIASTFGSFSQFKEEFSQMATTVFGSGWAWLVVNEEDELEIVKTPNQDNPISYGKEPILGVDMWEHAYYLDYQNNKGEYVEAFWNVINWEKVAEFYDEAK